MSVLDRVAAAARRSPEGALLFVAGCALLMRDVGAAANRLRTNGEDGRMQPASRGRSRMSGEAEEHGFVDSARAYASNVAGTMAHSAEAAVEYARDTRRAAVSGARTGAAEAMDSMLVRQPLTVGLIGIAAGALIAAVLPGSGVERRAFAPVGDRIGEKAEDARRRLKRAAARTRARVAEVAEEHGLTAEGLKGAALDVAETFSDELIGDGQQTAGVAGVPRTGKAKRAKTGGSSRAESGKARSAAAGRARRKTPAGERVAAAKPASEPVRDSEGPTKDSEGNM